MASQKSSVNDIITKYESGKTLVKADCKVVIDALYNHFLDTYNNSENLETIIFYDDFTSPLWDMLISNAENVAEKNNRPFSVDEVSAYYGLHFCTIHDAKLAGMESCSSSNLLNKFCQRNKNVKGSICEKCFADAIMKMRASMRKPYAINFLLLNYCELPISILPMINRQYERIESFGDVASYTQAKNYYNLTQAHAINRACRFGIWSKNPIEYFRVFEKCGKPNNISFGVSSLMINRENRVLKKYIPFVDFLFTVFRTEKDASAQGLEINCGARHCLSCLKCYRACDMKRENGANYLVHVIELLK